MANIKVINLVSGESIIGEIVRKKSKKKEIYIKDPLRIVNDFDPATGNHQTFLLRWIPQSDERLYTLPLKNIMVKPVNPSLIMENYYYDTCENIWVDDGTNEQLLEKQMRRIQLQLMLEKPTRKEEIN